MELIRKNIGLISYALVCVALGVVIFVGIRRAATNAGDYEAKIGRQVDFFKEIRRNQYTLSQENVRIARENQDMVDLKFRELRTWLGRQYGVPADRAMSSVECVRTLQIEISRMDAELKEKNVLMGSRSQFFTFDRIAKSDVLPPASQVPGILRKLKIIREVVRLVGLSGVAEITDLARPLDLAVFEEGLYTVTPINISVVGSMEAVEKLVNLFNRESTYLFFLRSLSLATRDQAPGGVIPGFADAATRPGGTALRDRAVVRPAPAPWNAPRAARRPPSMIDSGEYDADPREFGPGRATATDAEAPSKVRTDLLVFQKGLFQAELTFDLVEFRQPTEEK